MTLDNKKQKTNLRNVSIAVVASMVLVIGTVGFYSNSFDSNALASTNSMPAGAALLSANVKVTHFGENGEVKDIRHGANHITATGMSILMGQLFSGVNSTYPDQANVTGRVGWMEIGTSGEQAVYSNLLSWNNTDIVSPVGSPCIRVAATIDNSTQGPAHKAPASCNPQTACSARMNVTAIAEFDGANCSGAGTIDEAGIFTASTAEGGGLMFARNTFGSVVLGAMDTLQLEWEFTFSDS